MAARAGARPSPRTGRGRARPGRRGQQLAQPAQRRRRPRPAGASSPRSVAAQEDRARVRRPRAGRASSVSRVASSGSRPSTSSASAPVVRVTDEERRARGRVRRAPAPRPRAAAVVQPEHGGAGQQRRGLGAGRDPAVERGVGRPAGRDTWPTASGSVDAVHRRLDERALGQRGPAGSVHRSCSRASPVPRTKSGPPTCWANGTPSSRRPCSSRLVTRCDRVAVDVEVDVARLGVVDVQPLARAAGRRVSRTSGGVPAPGGHAAERRRRHSTSRATPQHQHAVGVGVALHQAAGDRVEQVAAQRRRPARASWVEQGQLLVRGGQASVSTRGAVPAAQARPPCRAAPSGRRSRARRGRERARRALAPRCAGASRARSCRWRSR